MSSAGGDYGFGIEEEYFLADKTTLDVRGETPEPLFKELAKKTDGRGGRESLQAQLEISTAPTTSVETARDELKFLRTSAAEIAGKHGLAILASGTHPTAEWQRVEPTSADRYFKVMDSLQMIGRRNMLCGMHVHVELPDPDRRVDVMVRMLPYVPLFIALSTSSPFWHSRHTGLKSYRLAAYDELPRSGLPELFANNEGYESYVNSLIAAGIISDASYIWWAMRLSHKYPTLELRAPDCCTKLEDGIAIACLFRTIACHLYRNPGRNSGLDAVGRGLAVENKWNAQRFGVNAVFANSEGPATVGEFLEEVIEMIKADANMLGCLSEVEHCRSMVSVGTSADEQLSVFEEKRPEGKRAALKAVAEWIAQNTLAY